MRYLAIILLLLLVSCSAGSESATIVQEEVDSDKELLCAYLHESSMDYKEIYLGDNRFMTTKDRAKFDKADFINECNERLDKYKDSIRSRQGFYGR